MAELPNGLYEQLLTTALQQSIGSRQADLQTPDAAARRRLLAHELGKLLPTLLDALDEQSARDDLPQAQLINQLLVALRRYGVDTTPYTEPLQLLRAVHPPTARAPTFPPTGLSAPWLFTAGRADPSLYAELRAELSSADRIDVLVSFITWSGLRKIIDVLEAITAPDAHGQPGTRMRIITTTYTGATESQAVEQLAKLPGVALKISLDGARTRLHAKAWMFHRKSGFGTAFVGSANLSAAALLNGIEWTVKFTESAQRDLFTAAEAHFETLWNDAEFQTFDPDNAAQCTALKHALGEARHGQAGSRDVALPTWFDLRPRAFQTEMLERLAAERRHGRMRNLLVAATGTGKTMVAAFDYLAQTQHAGAPPRLLFVAHRIEILRQAMATFRQVLKRADFGELLADGGQVNDHQHLFATVASVHARALVQNLGADYWHTVIVDECHHLPAQTFTALMNQIKPKILLGLTATPERADGLPVASFFDARPDASPAAELRLWDALDQQLLAPFEYYATADDSDLRTVAWGKPQQEARDLSKIFCADHARAKRIIDALNHYTDRRENTRAIAFCVDIAHANFMADCFNQTGWPALAVTSQTPGNQRRRAPQDLANGTYRVLCTCDLYNEGVDIPDANTLLFLRPTQSPVVFAQQLGRGLRLAAGKDSCLVLDFVGRVHDGFRFDQIFAAITGLHRKRLIDEIENGFASLPPGCHIQFDKQSRERVLGAIQSVSNQNWRRLTQELRLYAQGRDLRALHLLAFLQDQCLSFADIYDAQKGGWTALKRAAGVLTQAIGADELKVGNRLSFLSHINDGERTAVMHKIAARGAALWPELSARQQRMVQMLAYQLFPSDGVMDAQTFLARLDASPQAKQELGEVAQWLDLSADLEPRALDQVPVDWPLLLHGAYSRAEILSACGVWHSQSKPRMSEGVLNLKPIKTQLLFVTLDKKQGFSARVAYHDYAISPTLFHWQSQNSAGAHTPSGQRYIQSRHNGWRFQLFVRENLTTPFIALGAVRLANAPTGSQPMSMVWQLERAMPLALFRRLSVLRT